MREHMDKDRVKGKIEDIKGRVKRQAGEWTGNERLQDEGAMQQGKVQNAWGKVKDAARDVKDDFEGKKKDDKKDDRAA